MYIVVMTLQEHERNVTTIIFNYYDYALFDLHIVV